MNETMSWPGAVVACVAVFCIFGLPVVLAIVRELKK